jgi:hypothetical protein
LPFPTAKLMAKTFGANQTPQPIPLSYIESYCRNDGLFEQWIETTSEVVSILIGSVGYFPMAFSSSVLRA